MLLVGVGKADITAYKKGVGMLGYGLYHHIMLGVETPLYSRAFVIDDQTAKKKCVIINCELAFITPSLKRGVLKELAIYHSDLGYMDHNLLLSAQHTHCAPTGYSFHGLYNMNGPGFIPEIYKKIVDGIVESILLAEKAKVEGKIQLGTGSFSPEIPVSFNRSIRSYNQNPEVKTKLTYEERHLAVDREMTLLKIVDSKGLELGSINWFAVHTTNLPNTFTKLCSDNKGFAATYMEDLIRAKNPNYIAAFAQGACGDVSARYKINPKLPFQRGKYEGKYSNDLESSKYNGQLQFEKALEISEGITEINSCGDVIDSGLMYVDFANINVLPEFAEGRTDALTGPSCLGVSFLEGSKMDGPGMPPILGFFARGMARFVKLWDKMKLLFLKSEKWKQRLKRQWKAQGNKDVAVEPGNRRMFGTRNVHRFILPGFADELIRNLKIYGRKGALKNKPWTPQILPLQIVKIGNLAIVAIPFEITTIASFRLKKTVEDILLGKNGYEKVLLAPYANAYSGYITTFEEYQLQDYEGGHNVFGQWSLNALQQQITILAKEMLKPAELRELNNDIVPQTWTEEELQLFEHFEGFYFKRLKNKEARLEKRLERVHKRLNNRALK